MRTPAFWDSLNPVSAMLWPLSLLYGAGRKFRKAGTPLQLSVPVICVGNATAGGAGKTPVALAIGALLKERGINAFFLSRGYGGSLRGPVQVNETHTAQEVGDEPLLLARCLPTIIARDRAAGAQAAIEAGAKAIIMDDGFQNNSLLKNASLLVVDGASGFGNGLLLPAGPLREPLAKAFARADGCVIIGSGAAFSLPEGKPQLQASIVADAPSLKGQRVHAFCGIARPQKFWDTLAALGADVLHQQAYGDHQPYKAQDIQQLAARAKADNALLVTTEKDAARLTPELRALVVPVPITLSFADPAAFRAWVEKSLL